MTAPTVPASCFEMHRCPLCGEAFPPQGIYSHGRYADHMIRVHKVYGPPCDDDCAGLVGAA